MVFAFMRRPPFGITNCGEYNGYVGWTKESGSLPKSYMSKGFVEDELDLNRLIDVHGGITFDEVNIPYEKFVPEVKLTKCPDSFDGCRIIGFDVCHFDDGPHHDYEWCRAETMRLYEQVVKMLSPKAD